jgi:hypothetical protein
MGKMLMLFLIIYLCQCEDDLNLERNYIWAIGRLAEVEGEASIYSDLRANVHD